MPSPRGAAYSDCLGWRFCGWERHGAWVLDLRSDPYSVAAAPTLSVRRTKNINLGYFSSGLDRIGNRLPSDWLQKARVLVDADANDHEHAQKFIPPSTRPIWLFHHQHPAAGEHLAQHGEALAVGYACGEDLRVPASVSGATQWIFRRDWIPQSAESHITDAHLQSLQRYSELRIADLEFGSEVTDAGLASLSALGHIEELSVARSVHGRGLANLKAPENLRRLRKDSFMGFSGVPPEAKDIGAIAACAFLSDLQFAFNNPKPALINRLENLPDSAGLPWD